MIDPSRFPKVVVGIRGDRSSLPPGDAILFALGMQAAADCINNADHEKIHRQYVEGRMGETAGFQWHVDLPPPPPPKA